ncbi:tetratricopeptide repeat protein [Bosea beijingensis]|uniref:tetratricopeptide repeat protein n=1 Tax=Bosea beijingensis TaxID=3068632 RepID=UPI002741CB88|nr:tetratricopeptide repeat protein [Bosea sp. REN20]
MSDLWGSDRSEEFGRLVANADRLRDAGSFAEASKAYEAALKLAPQRHDIRVQLGNMLKDTGRHVEAEAAYRRALVGNPSNADIFVQLGHVLKLQGRRLDARASYLEAVKLPGGSPDAQRELLEMGDSTTLATAIRLDPAQSSIELAAQLAVQIGTLRQQIEQLSGQLASSFFLNAYPRDCWRELRATLDMPKPPELGARKPVFYLLDASGSTPFTIHLQVAALVGQSEHCWKAVFVGAEGAAREALERLVLAEARITMGDTVDAALATLNGPVLLAEAGAILHEHVTAWLLYAAAIASTVGFTLDFEIVRHHGQRLVPVDAVLRGRIDPEALAEADCVGPLLFLPAGTLNAAGRPFRELANTAARTLAAQGRLGHIPLPLAAFPEGTGEIPLPLAPTVGASAPSDRIAVIIPTRNHGADAEAMVASLRKGAVRPDLIDVIVMDNGSTELQTKVILASLEARGHARILHENTTFNWSYLNNRAAGTTEAAILVFANDDMALRSQGWDAIVRTHLSRPEIGALGARLLYPDGAVQHAGVLEGWPSGVIHDGLDAPGEDTGPAGRWRRTRRVAAVTGAFLAVRRENFEALNGFDASLFAISYGDIDFCMRLRERGAAVLWTPWIELTHHESRSRGADHADEARRQRSDAERLLFEGRWGNTVGDPSVNPFWLAEGRPFRLLQRPSLASVVDFMRSSSEPAPWRAYRQPSGA